MVIPYITKPSITERPPLTKAEINFEKHYEVLLVLIMLNLIYPLDLSEQKKAANGSDDKTGRKIVK